MNDDSISDAARRVASSADRAAFLDDACRGDVEQRNRVESLLAADGQTDSLLDEPLVSVATEDFATSIEQPGQTIGPYKLLQQIGEGGFGVVYLAEQQEPVRRRVAVKVIKPGMDSRQVIARFEAERQALAMMDHPNIAKVLDAGMTSNGRPQMYGVFRTEQSVERLWLRDNVRDAWPTSPRTDAGWHRGPKSLSRFGTFKIAPLPNPPSSSVDTSVESMRLNSPTTTHCSSSRISPARDTCVIFLLIQ